MVAASCLAVRGHAGPLLLASGKSVDIEYLSIRGSNHIWLNRLQGEAPVSIVHVPYPVIYRTPVLLEQLASYAPSLPFPFHIFSVLSKLLINPTYCGRPRNSKCTMVHICLFGLNKAPMSFLRPLCSSLTGNGLVL